MCHGVKCKVFCHLSVILRFAQRFCPRRRSTRFISKLIWHDLEVEFLPQSRTDELQQSLNLEIMLLLPDSFYGHGAIPCLVKLIRVFPEKQRGSDVFQRLLCRFWQLALPHRLRPKEAAKSPGFHPPPRSASEDPDSQDKLANIEPEAAVEEALQALSRLFLLDAPTFREFSVWLLDQEITEPLRTGVLLAAVPNSCRSDSCVVAIPYWTSAGVPPEGGCCSA